MTFGANKEGYFSGAGKIRTGAPRDCTLINFFFKSVAPGTLGIQNTHAIYGKNQCISVHSIRVDVKPLWNGAGKM